MEGVKYVKKATVDNARQVFEDCLYAFQAISNTLFDNLSEERYIHYDKIISELIECIDHIFKKKQAGKSVAHQFKSLYPESSCLRNC